VSAYRDADSELHRRITDAERAVVERDHVRGLATALAADIARTEATVKELEAVALKEHGDAERYRRGVWAFLYGLFADREARHAKEHAEALAAAARLQEAQGALAVLRDRHARAVARSRELTGIDVALMRDRIALVEQLLAAAPHDPAARGELARHAAALAGGDHQLTEARTAAQDALAALARLDRTLSSAANWGVLDLFGGGLFTSWAKHERLDEARGIAGEAAAALTILDRELEDVGMTFEHAFDGLGTGRFLDVWFDNIFSDLAAQDRIAGARKTVTATRQQVEALVADLDARRASLAAVVARATAS
jgi:hypothetical protein